MTVGESQALSREEHEQPMTALDHPGGPTLAEHPELGMSAEQRAALEGPFTTRQLLHLDHALRTANEQTGLAFSVYLGELAEPTRESAQALHAQIKNNDLAVLLAASPNQRVLEIVTGSLAKKRISDRDAKLAALSMAAAFAGGDLAGGVMAGLDQLSSHAGRS